MLGLLKNEVPFGQQLYFIFLSFSWLCWPIQELHFRNQLQLKSLGKKKITKKALFPVNRFHEPHKRTKDKLMK